jgi:serralysin
MSDVPGDTTTTTSIASGTYLLGTIDTLGDGDWYAFEVEDGETFRFFWNASSDAAGVGADFKVYNSSGNFVVGFDNPGDWTWITIQWKFATGGTYYLGVGGASNAPTLGGYSVAVNLLTDSPTEAIDWGTYLLTDTVDIYFAPPGGVYPVLGDTLTAVAWTDYLIGGEMAAFG